MSKTSDDSLLANRIIAKMDYRVLIDSLIDRGGVRHNDAIYRRFVDASVRHTAVDSLIGGMVALACVVADSGIASWGGADKGAWPPLSVQGSIGPHRAPPVFFQILPHGPLSNNSAPPFFVTLRHCSPMGQHLPPHPILQQLLIIIIRPKSY